MSKKYEEEEEYEVEKIVDKEFCETNNMYRYLVKWKNYSSRDNTWVLQTDLNCPELLEKFYKQQRNKVKGGNSLKRRRMLNDSSDEEKCVHVHKQNKGPDEEFSEMLSDFLKQFNGKWRCKRVRPGTIELNYTGHLWGPYAETAIRTTADVRVSLQHFETYLQEKCEERKIATIIVENNVDLEVPPRSFRYITECIWSPSISVNDDAIVGCKCQPFCSAKTKCACPLEMDAQFAYRSFDKLAILPGNPIFECNKNCLCGIDCPNRTVQRGRQYKLCIFRTSNGRGWGVKTLELIKKDSYVMEYVGEVIGNHEADVRYEESGAEYLFDLDFFEKVPDYVIDATYVGNESHFVNHSCEPNMTVYNVFIDHLDMRLPRIALFAARDIAKYEELTFDYAMCSVEPMTTGGSDVDEDGKSIASDSNVSDSDRVVIDKVVKYAKQKVKVSNNRVNGHVKCRCGSKKCRGFVFLDKRADDADVSVSSDARSKKRSGN